MKKTIFKALEQLKNVVNLELFEEETKDEIQNCACCQQEILQDYVTLTNCRCRIHRECIAQYFDVKLGYRSIYIVCPNASGTSSLNCWVGLQGLDLWRLMSVD